MRRFISWLLNEFFIELYGVEDRLLARMKQQEDEIWPDMCELLEKRITDQVANVLVDQSLRVVGGRPNTRSTTPLDEAIPDA